MIANRNYNVGLANLLGKKIMYDFAKGMYFDVKAQGYKSTRDRRLIKLPNSQGLLISASGVSSSQKQKSSSNTIFYHQTLMTYVTN